MAAQQLPTRVDGDEATREPVRVPYQHHAHGPTA